MASLNVNARALDDYGAASPGEGEVMAGLNDVESGPSPPARKSSSKLHALALSDQAIVSGSNFVTSMVLARGLSLAEFGKYSLLWMAILLGANIQMSLIIAPMMSIGPIQRRLSDLSYLGAILAFQLLFATAITMLMAAVVTTLALTRGAIDSSWILPLLATNIAYQLQDFARRVFFYQKRGGVAVVCDCISYLGQLLLIGLCMKVHLMSVKNVLWVNALTSVLAIGFAVPMMPAPVLRLRVLRLVLKRNWQSARYLLAATLMQWTSGNLFVLMAPMFMGVSAAGAMRACQSIMNTTNIWMQGLENSLPSEASRIMIRSGR